MSTALKLSVAEYDAMIAKGALDGLTKKIELINGEIQAMNPAGPIHDDLIEYLNNWSVRNTDPKQIRVRIQSGLSLRDLQSRPEPDVLWVKARRYLDRHPESDDVLLLLEISDSSLRSDRDNKAVLYAKAGIVEYWIVNVADEMIHVYRQPSHDGYRSLVTIESNGSIAPLAEKNAILSVGQLFGDD